MFPAAKTARDRSDAAARDRSVLITAESKAIACHLLEIKALCLLLGANGIGDRKVDKVLEGPFSAVSKPFFATNIVQPFQR